MSRLFQAEATPTARNLSWPDETKSISLTNLKKSKEQLLRQMSQKSVMWELHLLAHVSLGYESLQEGRLNLTHATGYLSRCL